MNIYGQTGPREEAWIVATKEELKTLRLLIDAALQEGSYAGSFMNSEAFGFDLIVLESPSTDLEPPYAKVGDKYYYARSSPYEVLGSKRYRELIFGSVKEKK
jgi:hypothetical protein